jgi:diguanylate cyclase (GGDEF)-like protein/PAS domain S-box-containing protein
MRTMLLAEFLQMDGVLASLAAEHWQLVILAGIFGVLAAVAAINLLRRLRAERARFNDQRAHLDAALGNMRQGLLMFDAEGRLVLFNQRFVEMYDLPPGTMKAGLTLRDILQLRKEAGTFRGDPDKYVAKWVDQIGRFRGDPDSNKFVEDGVEHKVFDLPNGKTVSVTNQSMRGGGWVSTHTDITDHTQATKELQRTKNFLDTVVENVPVTLIVKDAQTQKYVLINRAGELLLGVPRERIIGKTAHDFFPKESADTIVERDTDVLLSGDQHLIENNPLPMPDGTRRLVTTKRLAIRDHEGKPQYLVGVIEDVTERRRAEERIAHMAHHDPLTDLPNRAAFSQHLASMLDRSAAAGSEFAVLCIDLDRFKEVNDVFGHSMGDALLTEVARRLKSVAGDAFLARLGGDEFTLVAEGPQPTTAETLADQLLAVAADDLEISGQPLRIGLSIGVAIYPTDGTDAAAIVANADAALYRSKSEGRAMIRFFDGETDKRLRDRRALQHDLRSALSRGEFVLHYQPQALVGGEIIGFEALVRWHHPTRGLVPPGVFVPLAEENGLILELGQWIIREACREAATWQRPLQIAINLSPVQFRHGDLAGIVHAALLETGLPAKRLELEITEGVLIGDFSRALSILRRLKAMGVRISMDDFGTGYSSLSYLQAFPFDKIKIDQSFIANADRPQSAAIIRAIIGLGRGLDLPVVAEGVETREQLAFLSGESCREVQGFLIGKPRPISDYQDIVGPTDVHQPASVRATG